MKKLFTVFALLFFAAGAFAQETNVTSFRNMPWGAFRDSMYVKDQKVEFVKDKSSLTKNAYIIPNDDMTIGNVKLNKIDYIFNDEGRFVKVYLEGPKEQSEQMKFILDYKFGTFKNESRVDNVSYKQWLVKDVTFTLGEYDYLKFEVKIESNWQASEAYKKNTSVDDF
ncbi:MAG: hypothetical protein JSS76_07500 [Bacteroidetes bacterium]|nr:hypothetical protein [Bacteroidota bacterium]MBS1684580.1 hypothetical protein [Bacteroidota bacterium]